MLKKEIRVFYIIIDNIHRSYVKYITEKIKQFPNSLFHVQKCYDDLLKYRNEDDYLLNRLNDKGSVACRLQKLIKDLRKILDKKIGKSKKSQRF